MLRRVLLCVIMVAMLTIVAGIGQTEPREQLVQLLLTQEQLTEAIGGEWAIDSIKPLEPEPEGSLTLTGRYLNLRTNIELIIGLLVFDIPERANTLLDDILKLTDTIKKSTDLHALAKEGQLELPELLRPEAGSVERLLLLELVNSTQQLMFRHKTLIAFFRTPILVEGLGQDQLIKVADRQLRKILEFCAGLESETKPKYC